MVVVLNNMTTVKNIFDCSILRATNPLYNFVFEKVVSKSIPNDSKNNKVLQKEYSVVEEVGEYREKKINEFSANIWNI